MHFSLATANCPFHCCIHSFHSEVKSRTMNMKASIILTAPIILLAIYCQAQSTCDDWIRYEGVFYVLRGPFLRADAMDECQDVEGGTAMDVPRVPNFQSVLDCLGATQGLWLNVKRNRTDKVFQWRDGEQVIQSDGSQLKSAFTKCVKYKNGNYNKVDCASATGHVVCQVDPYSV